MCKKCAGRAQTNGEFSDADVALRIDSEGHYSFVSVQANLRQMVGFLHVNHFQCKVVDVSGFQGYLYVKVFCVEAKIVGKCLTAYV